MIIGVNVWFIVLNKIDINSFFYIWIYKGVDIKLNKCLLSKYEKIVM